MYNIIATKKFEKKLSKLIKNSPNFHNKIKSILTSLVENPFDNFYGSHKLKGKLDNFYSCNCGYDCRVLYKVNKEDLVIMLIDIGTHDEVYL